jgi:hypothetical protein
MPRRVPPRTSPASAAGSLADDQIDRWADLIADGRDAFPEGLPEPDHERLLAAVRRRLRDRLVRLIARAIAARLYHRARPGTEDPEHA